MAHCIAAFAPASSVAVEVGYQQLRALGIAIGVHNNYHAQ